MRSSDVEAFAMVRQELQHLSFKTWQDLLPHTTTGVQGGVRNVGGVLRIATNCRFPPPTAVPVNMTTKPRGHSPARAPTVK